MNNTFKQLDKARVGAIRLHVEDNSQIVDGIIKDIIKPYTEDLDKYVTFVAECLKDGERPPTGAELEDFCMNLSAYLYFAGGMCEQLGIRDDIAQAVYKETYNTARDGQEGTVQDKNSVAEILSQQEQITAICYNRAYRIVKAKIDKGQELLTSCKKVLSHRMQEMELTKFANN